MLGRWRADGDTTIRVIDLADPEASALIDAACRDTGFLVVINHGVDQTVIDTAWAATRRFFDLPIADKMAVAMPYRGLPLRLCAGSGRATRGIARRRHAARSQRDVLDGPDRSTGLVTGTDAAEAFVYEPTPWPSALPELQPALEAYYDAMSDLVARIMTSVRRSPSHCRPRFFDSRIDRHTSALRLLNYPALLEAPEPGQLRAGAHTDYGTVTVLRADDRARRLGGARTLAVRRSLDRGPDAGRIR